MKFGDGIDWAHEARRAYAADVAKGQVGIGRSDLVDRVAALVAPGARVLDAGCNIGRYAPLFVAAGLDYTGVDQSEEALDIATRVNADSGARFFHAALWDLDFPEPFDAAVSFAVLQHNTIDEQERIMAALARSVRPGGVLVMSESTVPVETATQRTHEGWIGLAQRHGFTLLDTWHPNPAYGYHDHYAFRRVGAAS